MLKRFGNVVFWFSLLLLAVLVVNAVEAPFSGLLACVWAAIIAAARYVLRGRL